MRTQITVCLAFGLVVVGWASQVVAVNPAPVSSSKYAIAGEAKGLPNLDLIAYQAGFRWKHDYLAWGKIEPDEPGTTPCRPPGTVFVGSSGVSHCFYWTTPYGTDDPGAYQWPAMSADQRVLNSYNTPGGGQHFAISVHLGFAPSWASASHGSKAVWTNSNAKYGDFVSAVAQRYGVPGYVAAFELWGEANIQPGWDAATFINKVLNPGASAIATLKAQGLLSPGLVVAPCLYNPSGSDMSAWLDLANPNHVTVDIASFHAYTDRDTVKGVINAVNSWAQARQRPFWITEFGFANPGDNFFDASPGQAAVEIFDSCNQKQWCQRATWFNLTDRTNCNTQCGVVTCGLGMFTETGCPLDRLCTVAAFFGGVQPACQTRAQCPDPAAVQCFPKSYAWKFMPPVNTYLENN